MKLLRPVLYVKRQIPGKRNDSKALEAKAIPSVTITLRLNRESLRFPGPKSIISIVPGFKSYK